MAPNGQQNPGQDQTTCDQCLAKLSTPSSLARHRQLVHSDERPYLCPVQDCPKNTQGFKITEYLNVHMKECHPNHPARQVQGRGVQPGQAIAAQQAQQGIAVQQAQQAIAAQPVNALQQAQQTIVALTQQLAVANAWANYHDQDSVAKGNEITQLRAQIDYDRQCFDQERQRLVEEIKSLREECLGRENKFLDLMNETD
ncbi:hypothetical protein NKR19_g9565 [Coniochaeta hoffmannii]|uniref:C2H2-type domain-containing protein n=1 Tax=Coniochaeta hoffmannii TaxID=91930 RepID=A0AA38VGY3_9PEZI|nr:hypothetical protein NKR19_g9565 [Coniochaeta hoffmannii]